MCPPMPHTWQHSAAPQNVISKFHLVPNVSLFQGLLHPPSPSADPRSTVGLFWQTCPPSPPPQPMGTLLRGFLLCHKSDVGHRGAVRALLCSAQCSQGKQSLHFSPIHALGKFAPQPSQAAPMEGLSPHSPALQSVPAKQSKSSFTQAMGSKGPEAAGKGERGEIPPFCPNGKMERLANKSQSQRCNPKAGAPKSEMRLQNLSPEVGAAISKCECQSWSPKIGAMLPKSEL